MRWITATKACYRQAAVQPPTKAQVHSSITRLFSSAHPVDETKKDIVIIGGGVMGLSTAFHLAEQQPDLSICVIEKDPTYQRASTPLSAGGIRQQFSNTLNIQMSQYGLEFLHGAPTRLCVDPEDPPNMQFVEHGYLFLASSPGQDLILKQNFETQTQTGASTTLLSPTELEHRFPWLNVSDLATGAFGLEGEGWFDPWALLWSLKRKCQHLGVEFIHGNVTNLTLNDTQQEITSVEYQKDPLRQRAETFRPQVAVINTAGAWSNAVANMAGQTLPIEARKRSVFVVHLQSSSELLCTNSPLVVDPSGVWFRHEGSRGHFICGTSPHESIPDVHCPFDEVLDFPDHEIFPEWVWPVLAHRVPAFNALKVKRAWSGFYETNVFDQNGLVGGHGGVRNFYVAAGFSGHGLQQAPAAGRALTELIFEGQFLSLNLEPLGLDRVVDGRPYFERNIV